MVELKAKVGGKGHILIPKIFRNKYSIEEGRKVTVEPTNEGLLIKGRPPPDEVMGMLEAHVEKLRKMGVKGPSLGDLKRVYLEMEFEEKRS